MKRRIIVILALILAAVIFLAACDSSNVDSGTDPKVDNPVEGTPYDFAVAFEKVENFTLKTSVNAEYGLTATTTKTVKKTDAGAYEIKTETRTPNTLGAEEQYTAETKTETVAAANYKKYTINVGGLTPVADGNIYTFALTSAQTASILSVNGTSGATVKIMVNGDTVSRSEVTYTSENGNNVSVVFTPTF